MSLAGTKRKQPSQQKVYAVRVGATPGIYDTWEECKAQVNNHKNALFKSFTSRHDAELFMNGKFVQTDAKFYAVRKGRVPGVYTDWPSAQAQIIDLKSASAVYKSFPTHAEAQRFIDNEDSTPATAEPIKKRKVAMSAAQLAVDNGEINENIEPGTDLMPTPAVDGYDQRLKMNVETGQLEYRTDEERKAVKMQPIGLKEDAILQIYTDGSTLGNGQNGAVAGVGVYFGPLDSRNLSEALRGDRQTNQRAELTGLKRAIDIAPRNRHIQILSDSKYAIQCVTEWFPNWRRNGWLTASKKPVENKDLIEPIVQSIDLRKRLGYETTFKWLKGHANDPGNTAADALAVSAAREAQTMNNGA